jgi:hypothetical protein
MQLFLIESETFKKFCINKNPLLFWLNYVYFPFTALYYITVRHGSLHKPYFSAVA